MVEGVLAGLGSEAASFVQALVRSGGYFLSMAGYAAKAGYGSRHRMARTMRSLGLPGWEGLTRWLRLLHMVIQVENTGASPTAQYLARGVNPAGAHRMVRNLTGSPWGEVRARGSAWVLLQIAVLIRDADDGHRRRKHSVGQVA